MKKPKSKLEPVQKQHRYTPSRLTSTRYHSIMQFIFDQMRDQKCTATVLAEKSGVSRYVIDKWRERPGKKLDNVTRVLAVLGYELTVKPITGTKDA